MKKLKRVLAWTIYYALRILWWTGTRIVIPAALLFGFLLILGCMESAITGRPPL